MQASPDGLVFSATDLSVFASCRHACLLEREVAAGRLKRPPLRDDPAAQLRRERGIEHEQRYLSELNGPQGEAGSRGETVVRVPDPGASASPEQRALATLELMREGRRVLYQAPLASGGFHGIADFLIRVDHRAGEPNSALGGYHYVPADAKLARETRSTALLQLCIYAWLLSDLMGREPRELRVVAPGPDGTPRVQCYPWQNYAAYFRRVQGRLRTFTQEVELEQVYPEPCEHCEICAWWSRCDRRRREDDHLSLVAGMSRHHKKLLEQAGVASLEKLARLKLPLLPAPKKLPAESLERLHQQARLQLEARSAKPRYELLPVEPARGLNLLPEPSPGDIFFDVEADRYALGGTFYYLLGYAVRLPEGGFRYHALWSQSREQERDNFVRLVQAIVSERRRFPQMHVYHFAPLEKLALGELSLRYLACESEVDDLLRSQVLVDLLPVVKQSLRAGIESYSLKDLEQLYGYRREVDLRLAARSRRLYELARELDAQGRQPSELEARRPQTPNAELRDVIENYNREDCESTGELRDFLEQLREELVRSGASVTRPLLAEGGTVTKPPRDWDRWVAEMRDKLLRPLPVDRAEHTPEQAARALLADLLDYHWRERKPEWWEYFRQKALTPEELLDDSSALGGLTAEADLGTKPGKKTKKHRYSYAFPPQESGLKVGDDVECPITGASAGEIVALDRTNHTLILERTPSATSPVALIRKASDIGIELLQNALREVATALAPTLGLPSSALDEWALPDERYPAATALLLRSQPRLRGGQTLEKLGEEPGAALVRVAPYLDGTILPVQGPPGAGKTHWGSRMVVELVRRGLKVGVTAPSHQVINNFLATVYENAGPLELRSLQKPGNDGACFTHPNHRVEEKKAKIAESLAAGEVKLVAGTAWLWADAQLRSSVDVLVIDEAGQFPLANALAVSVATRNLVLLGDPQQLSQPSKGTHPEGAAASALEHLLAGHETMPRGQGLFLSHTWRLPPNVARYISESFYLSELKAHPSTQVQRFEASGPAARFNGEGVFFEALEHQGNVRESEEEALHILNLVRELFAGAPHVVKRDGSRARLEPADILVVAPYNMQVSLVRSTLAAAGFPEVRVGTVDKFQGGEAPVVIYSLTTSHPEDAPRGFEFLFSSNRLNVALSRAQAIAIVVASPRLLEAECRTPEQMRLVNGLCRAAEFVP